MQIFTNAKNGVYFVSKKSDMQYQNFKEINNIIAFFFKMKVFIEFVEPREILINSSFCTLNLLLGKL